MQGWARQYRATLSTRMPHTHVEWPIGFTLPPRTLTEFIVNKSMRQLIRMHSLAETGIIAETET